MPVGAEHSPLPRWERVNGDKRAGCLLGVPFCVSLLPSLGDEMTTLLDEIAAYDRMRDVLETQHLGKWVVIRDGEIQASCDVFGDAARDAMRRFGRGPYLIRRVGAGPMSLPPSLAYS